MIMKVVRVISRFEILENRRARESLRVVTTDRRDDEPAIKPAPPPRPGRCDLSCPGVHVRGEWQELIVAPRRDSFPRYRADGRE